MAKIHIMKKFPFLITLIGLLNIAQIAVAQTTPRFSTSVNNACLKTTAEAFGTLTKDSCATVTWYSNIPGTTSYTSIGSGNRLVYTWSKAGTYNLCAKLVNQCTKFDTVICKTITVVACDCKLEASFSAVVDCKKVKFSAKTNMSGANIKWLFGDKTDGSGLNISKTYLKEGIYKVCMVVVAKDSTGKICTTEVCKEINVTCGKPCELKGDFKFGSGRNGEIRFNASSNSGYYYSWDFGDGTKGKGKDPLHRYTKAGVYTVCVTIIDKLEKCKITICKKVEVGNPCKIVGNFSFKQINDSTFRFLGSSSATATYFWNWGDGTTSTGKDAQKIYKKPGVYTVCMKIYSTTSKCFIYVCKKIEVKATTTKKPCIWPSTLSVGFSNKCNNYTFELSNLSTIDSCFTYQLSLYNVKTGKEEILTYNRLASKTIADTGKYAIIGKFINNCTGCDTQIYKVFNVVCVSTATKCNWSNAGFGFSNKCNNYTFEANNLGSAPCWKYQFKISNNSGSATFLTPGRLATYEFKSTGYYNVCVKFSDSCNKCDTWVCKTVYVDCTPCAAKASFVVDSVSTSGKLYLTNNSTSAKSFFWSFGDSTFSKDKTPSKTYSSSGTYVVCLVAYDSLNKCSTSYCVTIKVVKGRSQNTVATSISIPSISTYPNPTDYGFWIETSSPNANYRIISSNGSTIAEGNIIKNKTWINAADWANGLYIIQLKDQNGSIQQQNIVVQHP